MPCSRVLSRMLRSAGVQEPHRLFWLPAQATLAGCAEPAEVAAGEIPGPGRAGRRRRAGAGGPARRAGPACGAPTPAPRRGVKRAGIRTTVRSPSPVRGHGAQAPPTAPDVDVRRQGGHGHGSHGDKVPPGNRNLLSTRADARQRRRAGFRWTADCPSSTGRPPAVPRDEAPSPQVVHSAVHRREIPGVDRVMSRA